MSHVVYNGPNEYYCYTCNTVTDIAHDCDGIEVHTWCDAFGEWHARVHSDTLVIAHGIAHKAITDELAARDSGYRLLLDITDLADNSITFKEAS